MPDAAKDKRTRADKEQSRRFIATAREHGADERESLADNLLGKLARTPPESRKRSAKVKPDHNDRAQHNRVEEETD
jgi:hypothetical protein